MTRRALPALVLVIGLGACANNPASPPAAPVTPPPAQPYFIPTSISPQAQATYNALLPIVLKKRAEQGTAHTAEEFMKRREENIARAAPGNEALLKSLDVTVVDTTLGGVPVVDTRPPDYRDDHTILLHVHGGGFVGDSARSSVGMDARIALLTGKRIVSVDYTVAPKGRWPQVTDEVISVYRALLAQGYAARSVGMFGDSAGGNIVSTSTLKLRDQGVPMPGALVLLSPGTDLTQSGDTSTTLKSADPALGTEDLQAGFELYASPDEWKNPYVSPVFGDFSKGYPPTLIQVGTKEMLLSDSVRLYQAIKMAGGDAVLDVYEGMPHVFQSYMHGTPEQKQAFAEMKKFFAQHLEVQRRSRSRRGTP